MEKKRKFTVKLPQALFRQMETIALRRNVSITAAIEGVLNEGLKDDDSSAAANLDRRIGGLEKRMKSLQSDLEIVAELISFYVYQWLCYTSPIPEGQRGAVMAEGRERHKKFLELLGTRLAKGESSLAVILDRAEPLKD